MNRVNFIESISGIDYPEMIIHFFDHFIALKQLVEDSGEVKVLSSDKNVITFAIVFKDSAILNNAYQTINSLGGAIAIYGRNIRVSVEVIDSNSIKVILG